MLSILKLVERSDFHSYSFVIIHSKLVCSKFVISNNNVWGSRFRAIELIKLIELIELTELIERLTGSPFKGDKITSV